MSKSARKAYYLDEHERDLVFRSLQYVHRRVSEELAYSTRHDEQMRILMASLTMDRLGEVIPIFAPPTLDRNDAKK